MFDQDALGAVAADAGDGGARPSVPAGAAVQAVLPRRAHFQPGDVQGAGVGDGVAAARPCVCGQCQGGRCSDRVQRKNERAAGCAAVAGSVFHIGDVLVAATVLQAAVIEAPGCAGGLQTFDTGELDQGPRGVGVTHVLAVDRHAGIARERCAEGAAERGAGVVRDCAVGAGPDVACDAAHIVLGATDAGRHGGRRQVHRQGVKAVTGRDAIGRARASRQAHGVAIVAIGPGAGQD